MSLLPGVCMRPPSVSAWLSWRCFSLFSGPPMSARRGGGGEEAGRHAPDGAGQERLEEAQGQLRRDGSAASDRGRLFQADAVDERIGVPVRQLPVGSFTAKNQGDAQRPVLVR